ncbi:LysR family transcriptional regulator [Sphingomonas profundi]|uniref:LysR family transcriptional regulator n=1 Tax=Alterirhizorhabdus profundi TaxID=2681549 RepID=UPI0012E74BE7|nr:LysR family transcriptional regulator [Sphingomonas profundi]
MRLPTGFDLGSLEVFMLTAELGGMTQSGQHLGMTQSAVSQTIFKLEAALGVKLFDRTMRPLALTPSGKLLLQDGARLLSAARSLALEVREGSQRPAECVTIALAESLANHLTAPLLLGVGGRALRWQLRSGISLLQHHEFLTRKIDMLITGSSQLENSADVEHFPILTEEFILIAPADHAGPLDDLQALATVPFVRFSLLSAMGQRIERQLARMRLALPNGVEVDSTEQQLSIVAAGLGWSITTPLCVASHLDLLPRIRVAPISRAQFRRTVHLVARRGEFGTLPQDIATLARDSLRGSRLVALVRELPWLEGRLVWPGPSAEPQPPAPTQDQFQ